MHCLYNQYILVTRNVWYSIFILYEHFLHPNTLDIWNHSYSKRISDVIHVCAFKTLEQPWALSPPPQRIVLVVRCVLPYRSIIPFRGITCNRILFAWTDFYIHIRYKYGQSQKRYIMFPVLDQPRKTIIYRPQCF